MLNLGYISVSIDEIEKNDAVSNCDSDCDCWCDYDSCNDDL